MPWCFSLFVVLISVEMLTCPVSGGFKWCVIVFRFEKHVVTKSRKNCVCLGRAEKAWIYIFVLFSVLWSTVYLPVATQMKIRAPGCEDSASACFEITAVRTVNSYTNLLLLIIINTSHFLMSFNPKMALQCGEKRLGYKTSCMLFSTCAPAMCFMLWTWTDPQLQVYLPGDGRFRALELAVQEPWTCCVGIVWDVWEHVVSPVSMESNQSVLQLCNVHIHDVIRTDLPSAWRQRFPSVCLPVLSVLMYAVFQ